MDKLNQQLAFLLEADKMKTVLRQSLILDGSRRENDAEHSWHLALTALILREYAAPEVDIIRVLKMTLIHDLVEIYAGDTFAYDEPGNDTKEERERDAADRLFSMLPDEQDRELRGLWEEFDAMETPDALYAAAIDRFQSFYNIYNTDGYPWRLHGVTRGKIYKRMEIMRDAMPRLWDFVRECIRDGVEKGFIK